MLVVVVKLDLPPMTKWSFVIVSPLIKALRYKRGYMYIYAYGIGEVFIQHRI